ncbi:hypothetical protein EDD11_001633 [Mortierella claussenii]|nr:hypothetical protein EDD11_001633 [Mortierella claussenii]
MQDFSQLSVRRNSSPVSAKQKETAHGREDQTNASMVTLTTRASSYGTNSLFLTDYEKHDWLGYGQRYRAARKPSQVNDQELAISNELDNQKYSFLPQDPLSSTSRPFKGRITSLSDSSFSPWSLERLDNKENMNPSHRIGESIPSVNRSAEFKSRFVSPAVTTHLTLVSDAGPYQAVPVSDVLVQVSGEALTSHTGWPHQPSIQPTHRAALASLREPHDIAATQRAVGPSEHLSLEDPLVSNPFIRLDDCPTYSKTLMPSGSPDERQCRQTTSKDLGVPTRYVKVFNVPRDISIWDARDAFKIYGDLKGIFTTFLESDGILLVEFFDIRHAMAASKRLYSAPVFNDAEVEVQFCSKVFMSQVGAEVLRDDRELEQIIESRQLTLKYIISKVSADVVKNDNEGILIVSLLYPRLSENDTLRLLALYGDIRSFQTESGGWHLVALVEYYDTRRAAFAKAMLEELQCKKRIQCQVSFFSRNVGCQDTIKHGPFSPRTETSVARPSSIKQLALASTVLVSQGLHTQDSLVTSAAADLPKVEGALQPASPNLAPHSSDLNHDSITVNVIGAHRVSVPAEASHPWPERKTPTSLSAITVHEEHPLKMPASEAQPPTSTEVISYAAMAVSGVSNSSISDSVVPAANDKRTTFMIRNIPNKYTQPMLVECINETHFGQYDFLYLRMDFKNKCNVGYAFINFISTDVVASFVEQHVGKKWSRFNSDKICSLSYAAVQGRQALIDKFRNSSVMNEDPSYRPKIFYTSGPNIGEEEPFPQPTVMKGATQSTTQNAAHIATRGRFSTAR